MSRGLLWSVAAVCLALWPVVVVLVGTTVLAWVEDEQ